MLHPPRLRDRLALHTWTIDTTPLPDALRAVKAAGWPALELRRIDFTRCFDAGMDNAQVLEMVRAVGVPVGVLGTEYGLVFAKGDELKRLLDVYRETCANAVALGCAMTMIAPGQNVGTIDEAAANLRTAGEIAREHGVRLALEFNSQHDVINRMEVAREIIAKTGHPSVGLLLDAYHLERSGASGRSFDDLKAEEIFTFQYSDVPDAPPAGARRPTDRLPPGKGVVRWQEVWGLLKEKGYAGFSSYEAPNPAQWSRPAAEVAREGLELTHLLLTQVE
jgi:sugar phosphate isomerase/epimerase